MADEPRLLVVEDECQTRVFLVEMLAELGISSEGVGSLRAARSALIERPFDLLVVDRMLPDGSGLDLIAELRHAGNPVPILLLTALRGVPERVEGLEAGADDYMGKPFAPLELKARVRALLRRGHRTRRFVDVGTLRLDLDRHEAFVNLAEIPLTEREFRVLERLVTLGGVARDDLLEEVWGEATPEASASLDVFLSRLRRKLADRGLVAAIETVRGWGYRWQAGP